MSNQEPEQLQTKLQPTSRNWLVLFFGLPIVICVVSAIVRLISVPKLSMEAINFSDLSLALGISIITISLNLTKTNYQRDSEEILRSEGEREEINNIILIIVVIGILFIAMYSLLEYNGRRLTEEFSILLDCTNVDNSCINNEIFKTNEIINEIEKSLCRIRIIVLIGFLLSLFGIKKIRDSYNLRL